MASLAQQFAGVAVNNAENRERQKLKKLFEDAYERCRTAPMEGVSFTLDDFHSALDKNDFNSELGQGYSILHRCQWSISRYNCKIFSIIASPRGLHSQNKTCGGSWYSPRFTSRERCRKLQAEDVVVKGKVVGANKGGVVALVEGLHGFVPFSQIST
ncbi:30S ribosomal protein S1 chloroplastic, partial [Bienertia sinuspersici]